MTRATEYTNENLRYIKQRTDAQKAAGTLDLAWLQMAVDDVYAERADAEETINQCDTLGEEIDELIEEYEDRD